MTSPPSSKAAPNINAITAPQDHHRHETSPHFIMHNDIDTSIKLKEHQHHRFLSFFTIIIFVLQLSVSAVFVSAINSSSSPSPLFTSNQQQIQNRVSKFKFANTTAFKNSSSNINGQEIAMSSAKKNEDSDAVNADKQEVVTKCM